MDRLNNVLHTKTAVLADRAQGSGPPIATALDWVGPSNHAAAVAAFLCGDFFLGRYAGNYFAKTLLPTNIRHLADLEAKGIEASRLRLHCWHSHRQAYLEDEAHVMFDCPLYSAQRQGLLAEFSENFSSLLSRTTTSKEKLGCAFNARSPQDWQSIGRFLARVRQVRT